MTQKPGTENGPVVARQELGRGAIFERAQGNLVTNGSNLCLNCGFNHMALNCQNSEVLWTKRYGFFHASYSLNIKVYGVSNLSRLPLMMKSRFWSVYVCCLEDNSSSLGQTVFLNNALMTDGRSPACFESCCRKKNVPKLQIAVLRFPSHTSRA